MRRFQKNKGHRRPDPIDVLEGRVAADMDQILDLIHEVNPTGSDLPEEVRRRRYATKNRLQSLLLRRFGKELRVTAEPARDGELLIRIDLSDRPDNACHCLLSRLDEDVRTMLRRRFDEEASAAAAVIAPRREIGRRPSPDPGRERRGRSAGPRSEAPSGDPQVGGELLLGRQAQDAYDYDAARHHFTQALADHGGAAEAEALLSLLVDHLAADRDALDVMERLLPEVLAHGEVRLLLGLAAARCGETDLASDLGADLRGRRAAAIFTTLAGQALGTPDLPAVERHLRAARERDPTDPEVGRIEAEFFHLRAEERAPLEAELSRLLDDQDFPLAEERARALLERWPESEIGRRALRTATEHRREKEARGFIDQAVEELKRTEITAALGHFRAALRTGIQGKMREQLVELIAELEATERAMQAKKKVDEVVGQLKQDPVDAVQSMLAYLALAPPLRQQVQAQAQFRELLWLEQIEAARPGTPPRAAVDAVMALVQAATLFEGNPETALGIIAAHQRLLDHVPDAGKLAENARHRVQVQRIKACMARFESAVKAMRERRFDEAYQLVQGVDERLLPEQARPVFGGFAAEIRTIWEQEQVRIRFLKLVGAHDWLPARDLAAVQIAATTDTYQDTWRTLHKSVGQMVQRAFAVRVSSGPGPAGELNDVNHVSGGLMCQWLLTEPGLLLLAHAYLFWVFLRIVDYRTGEVRTRVSLRTDERIELHDVVVDEDSVWLLGITGAVLQLSLPGFRVLRWHPAERTSGIKDISKENLLEDIVLGPDGRHLWLGHQTKVFEQHVYVLDADRPHLRRDLGLRQFVAPVRGGAEPSVCAPKKDDMLIVCSPLGTVLREVRLPEQELLPTVAPHPSGKGLLCLTRPGTAGGDTRVGWVEIGEDGGARAPQPIARSEGCRVACIASALASGMSFVRCNSPEQEPDRPGDQRGNERCDELLGLRLGSGGLETAWQAPVPFSHLIVQDATAKRVVLLAGTEQGPRGVELGPSPPLLPDAYLPVPVDALEGLLSASGCKCLLPQAGGEGLSLLRRLKGQDTNERAAILQEARQQHEGSPEVLLDLLAALDIGDDGELRGGLAEWIVQRYPHLGAARVALAEARIVDGKWDEIDGILDAQETGALDGRVARHRHHLLGLLALHRGDVAKALRELLLGAACPPVPGGEAPACQLDELIALCTPLPEPVRPSDFCPGQPVVRQLLGAIRAADYYLGRGDPEGALAAVDRPGILMQREIQSLARLARAYLDLDLCDPARDFRKRLCLALFCRVWGEWNHRPFRQLPIPWPDMLWAPERLRDLVLESDRWLKDDFAGPEAALTYPTKSPSV